MEREFIPETEEVIGEEEEEQPLTPRKKKKNKMKNKRRFSDEQIRLLESIFESETRLEPRKKLQLARELGLQPRQVAIWFQNRRARWKSKQMEKEYRVLRANYDSLASKFESLKKEKQSLISQLQNLSELLAEPHDKAIGGGSENGETKYEAEGKQSFQQTGSENRGFFGLQNGSDRVYNNHNNDKIEQTGLQNDEFLSVEGKNNDYPSASLDKLYGLDSVGLFDHSCSNPQWMNFWI